MKLVSLIVAVYNVEQYIEKCLISIKNQTYTNIQVIVVDDGAKDNSAKICEDFAAKDSRFKVVHKENAGLGYARNTGLEHVEGDFVMFIDGDDFLEPNMVETFVKYQEETNSDMIICGFKRYIDDDHIKDVNTVKTAISFEGEEEIITKVLCPILGPDASKYSNDGREMCVWTNFYSMDVIRKMDLKFVSERVYSAEDFFFNVPFIRHCNKITMIPECLYNYRYNDTSLTNTFRPNRFELLNNLMNGGIEMLDREGISKYSSKRLDRLYFMKFRHGLLQLSGSNLSTAEKKSKIKEAVSDDLCRKVIKDYPIDAVKKSDSIMLKLIRDQKVSSLLHYMNLQRHMLVVRDYIRKLKND